MVKSVQYLRLSNGREPFKEWFQSLDIFTRTKVRTFIDRAAVGGGKKNIKSLGEGFF